MSKSDAPTMAVFRMDVDGDVPRQSRGTYEAQQHELLLRYRSREVAHDLRPGDLVRAKHGLSEFTVETEKSSAFILWRILCPLSSVFDSDLVAAFAENGVHEPWDCVVAAIDEEGNGIKLFYGRLCNLEPATPAVEPAA
jgi:hypothetical protein